MPFDQQMDETLWHKFNQHAVLKQELLDTGNAELIEVSLDGVCDKRCLPITPGLR